jgi:glycosyltransferase involved in cell wall biosynthesis
VVFLRVRRLVDVPVEFALAEVVVDMNFVALAGQFSLVPIRTAGGIFVESSARDPPGANCRQPMSLLAGLRVAVVHEWLIDYAGSERVVREMLDLLPHAALFALIDRPDADLQRALPRRANATTFLQSLPNPRRWLPYYVPLMPFAVEQIDLSGYDLVISSSHTVAKGVITGPDQLHLSYVHSPMRYAWDLQHDYLRLSGFGRGLRGFAARWVLHRLREWDVRSANGVDAFAANSAFVGRRIRKTYGREAEVIYPPVCVANAPTSGSRQDFYVTVSRLQPYKRVDLLVEAFAQMPHRRLVVIGEGPMLGSLRARKPRNVEILGYLPTQEVLEHMSRARGFLFAGIEDFGIALVESQACGTPVIAFAQGGAREIVRDEASGRPTGVLFSRQTVESVIEAVERFERRSFDIDACRENARRFESTVFRERFGRFLQAQWTHFAAERRA